MEQSLKLFLIILSLQWSVSSQVDEDIQKSDDEIFGRKPDMQINRFISANSEDFYKHLELSPTEQLVKVEKTGYQEEGIDCLNPQFAYILTRVKEPAISQVKKSFLDPVSGQLIVLSDKFYFYSLNALLSNVVSSDVNLENYKSGNSLTDNLLDDDNESSFESNAHSPGQFDSKSFPFMENYRDLISELQLVKTKYRNSFYNSGSSDQHGEPYHLFFMGSWVSIVHLGLGVNKSFNLGIRDHKFNRVTVSGLIEGSIHVAFYELLSNHILFFTYNTITHDFKRVSDFDMTQFQVQGAEISMSYAYNADLNLHYTTILTLRGIYKFDFDNLTEK